MTPPRVIVVGTDFTEQAEAASAYAVALARRFDARVCLVHGWQMPVPAWGPPEALAAAYPGALSGELQKEAEQAMSRAVERHRTAQVPVEGVVIATDPRDAVVHCAEQKHADLIIVATHGRRGFKRAVLGSIAEAVVRHAPCPVLVYRPTAAKPA